jgi:hypothetical protein
MQATITYLLTEQAQRAQMAATGQPVARKQSKTVEITTDDLAILDIDGDGNPGLDIAVAHEKQAPKAEGMHIALGGGVYLNSPPVPLSIPDPATDIIAFVREIPAAAQRRKDAEAAEKRQQLFDLIAERMAQADSIYQQMMADESLIPSSLPTISTYDVVQGEPSLTTHPVYKLVEARQQAVRDAKYRVQSDAATAFLEIATARATGIDNGIAWWVDLPGNVRVTREVYGEKPTAELGAEALRRKEADAAAKESAKRDYLASWIGEHGTGSQKARQADGVMCRDEAIKALVDFTFTPLDVSSGPTASMWAGPAPFPRHERPALHCTSEECCDECEISRSVTDGVDCLTESEHAWLVRIKAAMPDAKEYALHTHHVIHSCDHGDGCVKAINRSVVVKMAVGPFVLTREYAL